MWKPIRKTIYQPTSISCMFFMAQMTIQWSTNGLRIIGMWKPMVGLRSDYTNGWLVSHVDVSLQNDM